MNKRNKSAIVLSAVLVISMAIYGCKKYDNPPPVFEELGTISNIQRKVLVISIDGVTGSEINTIAPPNITELRKTSKYSYNVLRGVMSNDVSSWVSMITGVSSSKHLITDDTFMQHPGDDDHEDLTFYRNSLDYILQYKTLKTGFVTTWPELRTYLKVADYLPVVSTDAAVKDSTINLLKIDNLGALVVDFRDAEAAGANGGFIATNDNYKNAILKADEYVGNIVTALKARKNYANEDWLVIVTTNHGGSSADPKPGFLIASQKDLKEEELRKAGFNTVNFKTDAVYASVPDDNGLYNMSDNKDFTVQMDVKINETGAYYPKILGKSNDAGSTFTGWYWMQETTQWNLEFGGVNNGGSGKKQLAIPGTFSTGWVTLTMTVKYVNATTRTASAYVNGVFKTSYNVSGVKSIDTSEPLRLGGNYTSHGPTDFYAANLEIFNVALDDATIEANKDLKDITKHPNYSNLIGYWPIDEGSETIVGNKAPGGYDMLLAGNFTWASLRDDVPQSITPDPDATGKSIIITPTSVSALMLYWLNIDILPEFGIDGNPFLNQFEIEFLKPN